MVVIAPTGLAAYNVRGFTAHRFFKLPVFKDAKYDRHWQLLDGALKIIRQYTRNLKLILGGIFYTNILIQLNHLFNYVIADELSMFSNIRTAQMHLRLQEIFGNEKLFGGLNIVLFGDLLQVRFYTNFLLH